jgi:hypothetical protein
VEGTGAKRRRVRPSLEVHVLVDGGLVMARLLTIPVIATLLAAPLAAAALDVAQAPAPAAGTVKQKPPTGAITKRPRPPVVLRPDATTPPAPAASPAGQVSILPDGTIEERFANGQIKRSRPGVCGWTTVFPDGTSQSFQCSTNVSKLNLPVPTADAAQWLDQHAEQLLAIARGLLGPNADSVSHHLAANEPASMTVYDRIVVRTALVSTLSQAVTAR